MLIRAIIRGRAALIYRRLLGNEDARPMDIHGERISIDELMVSLIRIVIQETLSGAVSPAELEIYAKALLVEDTASDGDSVIINLALPFELELMRVALLNEVDDRTLITSALTYLPVLKQRVALASGYAHHAGGVLENVSPDYLVLWEQARKETDPKHLELLSLCMRMYRELTIKYRHVLEYQEHLLQVLNNAGVLIRMSPMYLPKSYENLSLRQLREIAENWGMKKVKSFSRQQLIDLLHSRLGNPTVKKV